jgi:hypothetical protein
LAIKLAIKLAIQRVYGKMQIKDIEMYSEWQNKYIVNKLPYKFKKFYDCMVTNLFPGGDE